MIEAKCGGLGPIVQRKRESGRRSRWLGPSGGALAAVLLATPLQAQDASWNPTPPSGDWNNPADWQPATVPTGTASFGSSSQTQVTIGSNTTIGSLHFLPGAPAYSFRVDNDQTVFTVNGNGIVNDSGNIPTLLVAPSDTSSLQRSRMNFEGSASAGNAAIQIGSFVGFGGSLGFVNFNGSSSAGSATINVTREGNLTFGSSSTLAHSKITNHSLVAILGHGAEGDIVNYDVVELDGAASLENASVTSSNGFIAFGGQASAGNAVIDSSTGTFRSDSIFTVVPTPFLNGFGNSPRPNGQMLFWQNATAGQAHVTNHAGNGVYVPQDPGAGDCVCGIDIQNSSYTGFTDTASAGESRIVNQGGTSGSSFQVSYVDYVDPVDASFNDPHHLTIFANNAALALFNGNATAGNATIDNQGGAWTAFLGSSTAGDATITASGGAGIELHDQSSGGHASVAADAGSSISLRDGASGGSAQFTANGATIDLREQSTAAQASFIANAGSTIDLRDGASAGSASFSIAGGATMALRDQSGGGQAAITVHGGATLSLLGSADAQNATLTLEGGASGFVAGSATGGQARLVDQSGAVFDISGLSASATAIGSIEGSGSIRLGGRMLTVGGNGLSTSFGGVLADGGAQGGSGGGLVKTGSGALTLSGSSTFTGATRVDQGSLLVTGSLASPDVQVGPGARLGGTGSLVGAVRVGDGGTLAPGLSVGTLSLGSLSLSPGALLAFDLGPPDEIGGAANDLVTVAGNLVLDGTLNVTNAGGFGNGVYRLIDYGGTLTDNGLAIGALPTAADAAIRAGQGVVNLIIGGSGPTQFWDGPNTSENGLVDGGSGSWSAGPANWTNADGNLNKPWGGQFAVFSGASGTVTVAGALDFTGLQFLTDGYRLLPAAGGALDLVGAQGSIRVDPGKTAEIRVAIGGTGTIVKEDGGTLVLTGANGWSGGTRIAAGTLQIGAGGTAGSVVGAIQDDSALVFDRSDAVVQAAPISGTGSLTQAGSGILTLASAQTYTGATRVSAGTLSVTGTLASPNVDIASGATLSGTGALAGLVRIADGGTIAPGVGVGTLTMAGLSLSSGSRLAFDLGPTGQIGGSFNDLLSVTGNLTLDGILDVTNAGGFGDGVYRLIDYGGSLIDNGLSLGSIPTSSDLAIQAGQGQVNLVVGGSGPTQFWDGSDLVANGAVDGGTGTWSNGPTNWTNSGGSLNRAWGGRFAVFAGPPGTVGLDGSLAFTGLQFLTDGYRLTGGGLDMAAGDALIRVDAGLAAGIATPIAGSGRLIKDDPGTLVLSGANGYSGGSLIRAGTLQIGAGGSSGSVSGDIENDGLLVFDRSDTLRYAGAITGSGGLVQAGSGTLVLAGDSLYSGGTRVAAGTLVVGAGGTAGSISGDVRDDGGLVFDRSDAYTFAGAILGSGSLTQAGSGTLVLTGAANVTGGTRIAAGSLQIGAGGATGSVTGDILDDGALIFDRSDTYDQAATIGGTGSVTQAGGGILRMSGSQSYGGTTAVDAGTLLVDGSLASPTVRVAGGATLGGSGTLAGAVDVADGGRIAPGNSPGTLALGSLVLSPGSLLSYDLGAPNIVGGGVNDLILVAGNLTLDGILDVADSGGFGNGVYRLIQYGGTLTDNGLSLGSIPTSADLSIRAGRGVVNLIVGGSGPTQFWDGPNAGENGAVDGGTGTWSAEGTNWTNAAGSLNLPWGGQFAVFSGAPGTVTVNGAIDFTGLQFLTDGYRIVAGGGASLNLAGDEAVVRVDPGVRAELALPILGSGRLVKEDGGTLILDAPGGWTGGTWIAAGTLQVGAGGTGGALGGTVDNRAALVFNRSDSYDFAGAISGPGSVTQAGSGTLRIGGTQLYTGPTNVIAGTLQVDGAIAGSAVTVAAGATLSGTGRVGTTSVSGRISPGGAGTGTLSVSGSYAQLAGSTYAVTLPAAGAADLIRVSGSASLSGGTVQVANAPATAYHLGGRTTILSADGGRTGSFAGVSIAAPLAQPFLGLGLGYDAHDAWLEVQRNAVPFATAATTANQAAAGAGLDGANRQAPLYAAVAEVPDLATARAAFDQLSGEIHASTRAVLVDDSRFLREAALGRLGASEAKPGAGLWADAALAWGTADGRGGAASRDSDTDALFVGIDVGGDAWRAGVIGGYTRSTVDVDARASHARLSGAQLGAYGGGHWGGTALRLGGALGWHKLKTRRAIAFSGFADADRADYDSRTAQLFAEIGETFALGSARLEPFAGLAYVHVSTDAFTERGGSASLAGGKEKADVTFGSLGLRALVRLGADFDFRGSAAWQHAFGDVVPTADLAFSGGAPFAIGGAPIARDAAALKADLSVGIAGRARLGLGYSGRLGAHAQDHGARATLTVRF